MTWLRGKLAFLALLSTVLLGSPAAAHELQPTIGDLTVADGTAELTFRINLEAFLAQIDLDAVADTDDAENASDYDTLRALPNAEIEAQLPALLVQWNAIPLLVVDGRAVELDTAEVMMPEGVDPELARLSDWTLRAELTGPLETAVVSWPAGAGALVLRQQGVAEPYTGYLNGGDTSPDIALSGGGWANRLGQFRQLYSRWI